MLYKCYWRDSRGFNSEKLNCFFQSDFHKRQILISGFQVRIHDQDDASSLAEDGGFLVPAGFKTIVSMTHENVMALNKNIANTKLSQTI